MSKWLFVDMETLGLSTESKVLSMGFLCIDEDELHLSEEELYNKGILLKLDVKNQKERTVDEETMSYWSNAFCDANVRNMFMKGTFFSLDEAYSKVESYIKEKEFSTQEGNIIFSRGLFDKFLWSSLYPKSEILPHYLWRDTITFLDIMTGSTTCWLSNRYMSKKHDALYNCLFELKRLRKAYEKYE